MLRLIGPLALLLVLLGCLAPSKPANAHEVRPAYLELHEVAPGRFDVLLKTPMRGDARLALDVGFSGRVQAISLVLSRPTESAMVQTWQLAAVDPLPGQEVRIEGLTSTMTDALVRVVFINGQEWVGRATPSAAAVTIPEGATGRRVAETYLALGFTHILLGLDHILFVLTLILLAPNLHQLAFAITAFTVAHSITLAAASLGVVHVPPAPVEAAIALSIVFVALETLSARAGRHDISTRAPWIVAFAFGLLHGLGFAGALSAIGLPDGHIPLALLFFNLGVEAGQETPELRPEDRAMLAEITYTAFYEALAKDYQIVREPGPTTMVVAVALTKAEAGDAVLNTASSIVPHARLLRGAASFITEKPAFVGEAEGEAKVTDSMTGELIGAGIDRHFGSQAPRLTTNSWDDVVAIIKYWSEWSRFRLCQERGDNDCVAPKS